MTPEEFRARRMELTLYQGNLAAQLHALGLELPGGQKIDQPAISMMERGKVPIPAEVAEAMASKVERGSDAPPPVGQGRAAAGGGGRRKRVTRKAPAAAPAAGAQGEGEPEAEPGPEVVPQPPVPGADPPPEPEPGPQAATDKPPVPLPAPRPRVTFDEAARSQLEADLRDLFAGQNFLVPVRVQTGADEYEIRHQEAHIPGLAQIVGAANEYDGRVIELHAAAMARAWADLAAENPRVRAFLMAATYGGAWRGVIAATMPVVLAIAANHGAPLPGFLGGVVVDAPQVA